MWRELLPIGRHPASGGYRRFAWTGADAECRAWFRAQAEARGLAYEVDRNGNQWAWLGDPAAGDAVVTGSHLDSVPDGGAFDGPLGVVSSFAALDELRGAAGRVHQAPRHRQLRRRGGRPVRARLRRLPAGRRAAHRRAGAPAARRRRGHAAAGHGGRRVRPRRHRPRPRAARPHRRLRRTARRAGPGAGPVRRPGRHRQRHLAARPLAVRLPGRGQPRRHHPPRGPARPDAVVRRDRARRPPRGRTRRCRRHLRQDRRRAERRQRHPLPGPRLARLPRRRPGDPRQGGRRGRAGRPRVRRRPRHRPRRRPGVLHAGRRVRPRPARRTRPHPRARTPT